MTLDCRCVERTRTLKGHFFFIGRSAEKSRAFFVVKKRHLREMTLSFGLFLYFLFQQLFVGHQHAFVHGIAHLGLDLLIGKKRPD